jgi:FtsH-binding integral membrane protein
LSYTFLALIAAHLALHWRWLWQVAAKRRAWPLVVGIGAGLVLMMWLALQPVEKRGRGHGQEREQGAEVAR